MKTKTIGTILGCWLISTITIAQTGISYSPGYVVDAKNDTLLGEIKKNARKPYELHEKVYLKKSETEKKLYRPNRANAFMADSVIYRAKSIGKEERFFLRLLCDGYLKLYDYRFYWENAKTDDKSKSEYYVEKEGEEELVRLKDKGNYVKVLESLMEDRQDLLMDFGDMPFDLDRVTELFNDYNAGLEE